MKESYPACPFWKKDSNVWIKCEGVDASNSTQLIWSVKALKEEYKTKYCKEEERDYFLNEVKNNGLK